MWIQEWLKIQSPNRLRMWLLTLSHPFTKLLTQHYYRSSWSRSISISYSVHNIFSGLYLVQLQFEVIWIIYIFDFFCSQYLYRVPIYPALVRSLSSQLPYCYVCFLVVIYNNKNNCKHRSHPTCQREKNLPTAFLMTAKTNKNGYLDPGGAIQKTWFLLNG